MFPGVRGQGNVTAPQSTYPALWLLGGSGCFPTGGLLSWGMRLVPSQKSRKSCLRWPSGRNTSSQGVSSFLCPWADFLPVTLFMLNENFRHRWPVRMWGVPSSDFHWRPVFSSIYMCTALSSGDRAALQGAEHPMSLSHVPGMGKDISEAWRK